MKKNKKILAAALAAAFLTSAFAMSAAAEEAQNLAGTAGIAFAEGNTVLEPGPDPALPEIASKDISFGSQELNPVTTTYSSVASHDDEDLKYAGFVVTAANNNGWIVTAQITGFELNGENTMANFTLDLIPGKVATTNSSSILAAAETVRLVGSNNSLVPGDSVRIFSLPAGSGPGKWGCNWAGELTVIGGSVAQAGTASATMLWTLVAADIQI